MLSTRIACDEHNNEQPNLRTCTMAKVRSWGLLPTSLATRTPADGVQIRDHIRAQGRGRQHSSDYCQQQTCQRDFCCSLHWNLLNVGSHRVVALPANQCLRRGGQGQSMLCYAVRVNYLEAAEYSGDARDRNPRPLSPDEGQLTFKLSVASITA
jgi:hypothetical protein